MADIIPFDPNKKSKDFVEKDVKNEPDKGVWTDHYDEHAARCFGTYTEWDSIAIMHLLEQIMNYMEAVDHDGSSSAMGAMSLAINAYNEKDYAIIIRELFYMMKYIGFGSYLHDAQDTDAAKTLDEMLLILHKKHPDL